MMYRSLVTAINGFSHPDLKRQRVDTQDRFDDWSNRYFDFPLMYHSPTSSTPLTDLATSSKWMKFNFSTVCLVQRIDHVKTSDDEVINQQVTTSNLDICHNILNHFILFMQMQYEEVTASFTPLNNFGIDALQGWRCDWSVNVINNECE